MHLPLSLIDGFVYLITGCAAGYLAGLFGVGGGIVIVPVLTFLFEGMAFPRDLIMQLSIGTSMASVTITAIISARTHHANGNVDWHRVRLVIPAVIVGVTLGALIGSLISRRMLALSVIAFEVGIACVFLSETLLTKNAAEKANAMHLPFPLVRFLGISTVLGAVSSVVGIAGGTLFVPFLNKCGMTMKRAIGTASAIGIPIGAAAASVYLITGILAGKPLPAHSAGYVYLPAFAGCTIGSFWTTKHGANLAKSMNAQSLKLAFAVVLLVAAGKMLWGILG